MKNHWLSTLIFVTCILSILACETGDDDKISKARACTSNAAKKAFTDAAGAATDSVVCDAIIADVNTPEASKIKFGNFLLYQRKMDRIANMVNSMKNGAGSGGNIDGMNAALPILVTTQGGVPSAPVDTSEATRGRNIAVATGSSNISKVAELINLATVLASVTAFTDASNADAVKTQINTCATVGCSPAQKEQIASALTSAQASACSNPSDNASTDPDNPCVKLKAMIGGATDATTIVNNLNTYLGSTH